MTDHKLICTAIEEGIIELSKLNEKSINKIEYQSMIGSLLYSANGSLNIAYAVNDLLQFSAGPLQRHEKLPRWVLGYIKVTLDKKLTYYRTPEPKLM
jgi:hypothetical protein